jgi:N-acyl-D-amino-acid deacylase
MKSAVREAMEHGAFGISSGLIYSPSCFADTDELIELCKVVAEYGGVYETHMRNESDNVVESVKEAIRIGREAGLPVCISHHKVQGRPNWGLSAETLKLIDEAVASGQKVTTDQYPYLASMTSMNAIIPPAYFGDNLRGLTEKLKNPDIRAKVKAEILNPETGFENQYINCGGFENIMIAALPQTPEYDGMTISEVSDAYGKDVFEMLFDLLVKNECIGSCIYFSMCEEDMCRIFMDPNTVVGTDGIYTFRGQKAHPRAWGTFPHAICYFHKQKQLVSLPEMIRKITLLPAQRAMIANKGAIKEGWDADLVVFDYDKLEDKADYSNTDIKCEGIEYVIVNGQVVYHDKKLTGRYPGRLIRHNGRR